MASLNHNIFIIGTTGSWKTPVSEALAKHHGIPHVKGSAWVQERLDAKCPQSHWTKEERSVVLTALSDLYRHQERGKQSPMVRHTLEKYPDLSETGAVFDGLRDLEDFKAFVKPRDAVIRLMRGDNPHPSPPGELVKVFKIHQYACDQEFSMGLMTMVVPVDRDTLAQQIESLLLHTRRTSCHKD